MAQGYPDPEIYNTTTKLLKYNADNYPSAIALREKDFGIWRELSWAGFNSRVRDIALALRARGLGEGDVVGLIGDNNIDWVSVELAVHAIGAMSMGIYRDALDDEVGYLGEYAAVTAVYAEDQEQIDKFLNLGDRLPGLRHIIFSDPRGLRAVEDDRLVAIDDLIKTGAELHAGEPGAYDALVPAGMMFDLAARTLGCAVVPGGVGQTDIQLQTIADLKPAAYAGTPSFLKILLEKAAEDGVDVSSMKCAAVGAEPFPPSVRQAIQDLGVTALQNYGTGDLGLVAYESAAVDGMILGEGIIVEILRPGTGDPVADGEVGEVVVTNLDPAYPLIRFATGDMSAVLPGISPCGRTNIRIKGWMGRADQTTKVRGMFVHPGQINDVLKRHGEVIKGRLTVDNADGRDSMMLTCEVADGTGGDALDAALRETIQNVTKLRGEVRFTGPGTLPNDGRVIDDIRTFE